VGFTGKPFVGGVPGPSTTGYAKIVAVAAPGQSTFDYRFVGLTDTPDCGSYDGGGQVLRGDLVVTDAQPPAPPT
jgi:hypothetical protein